MSTAEPESFDELQKFFNRPVLEKGDTIFFWRGRPGTFQLGWKFIGIPWTNYGISYYVVTGEETDFHRERLVTLVAP